METLLLGGRDTGYRNRAAAARCGGFGAYHYAASRSGPSSATVIPVLVTGIHLSADAGARGALDPGNKRRDDNGEYGVCRPGRRPRTRFQVRLVTPCPCRRRSRGGPGGGGAPGWRR